MSAVIIPTMRYKNASAAIDFICNVFGFARHMVHQEKDGTVSHAQLIFGNAMIMLSSEKDNDFGKLVGPPISNNNKNTMSPYIILDDIEAHYQKVKAAGAEIVYILKAEDYGGKAYSCKDAEGYLWNFGTYDPWKDYHAARPEG